MLRTWKTLVLVSGILLSFSGYAGVADCRNEWARPSSQTMSMDSAISFALTDYKNGERHFSVKQSSGQGAEIYYLKGAVLVKGYSQAQIEQFPQNGLFMMPMAFAVPIAILAEVAPNATMQHRGKDLSFNPVVWCDEVAGSKTYRCGWPASSFCSERSFL